MKMYASSMIKEFTEKLQETVSGANNVAEIGRAHV